LTNIDFFFDGLCQYLKQQGGRWPICLTVLSNNVLERTVKQRQ